MSGWEPWTGPVPEPEFCTRGEGDPQHTWQLTIVEGRMGLSSGCTLCDDAILSRLGGEDIQMDTAVPCTMETHVEKGGSYESPEWDVWFELHPVERVDELRPVLERIIDRFLDGWTPDLSSVQPDAWERIELDRDGIPYLVEPSQRMDVSEAMYLRSLPTTKDPA